MLDEEEEGGLKGGKRVVCFPARIPGTRFRVKCQPLFQPSHHSHAYAVLTNRIVLIRSDGDQDEYVLCQPSALMKRLRIVTRQTRLIYLFRTSSFKLLFEARHIQVANRLTLIVQDTITVGVRESTSAQAVSRSPTRRTSHGR